jgi:colanic acid biosynthesis glycosyl transferase WcaI
MLADTARMLVDEPRIFFLLCGDGLGRGALEASVSGLANVRLLPLQPRSRLNELLNSADIHLLPQRDSVAQLVLPSKLTGMLASGRPVVAGCGEATELAATVRRCGIAVPAGAVEPFAAAIRSLAVDPARRKELGRLARLIAEQEMSRERILQTFFDEAVNLVGKRE